LSLTNNWTVTNNIIGMQTCTAPCATGEGVDLWGYDATPARILIDGNIILGQDTSNSTGILIYKNVVADITNNKVTGYTRAISLSSDIPGTAPSAKIVQNFLTKNSYGIYVGAASEVLANHNYIFQNTQGAIYNASGVLINAEKNIWGTTDLSEIDGMVYGDVNYENPAILGAKGDKGEDGSPDTQIDILTKISQQADGAVLQMKQGPGENDLSKKILVQDKESKEKFSVSGDGTVTLGDDTAAQGGKLIAKQGLTEDDKSSKIQVMDKGRKAQFDVSSDGTVTLGNDTAAQGGKITLKEGQSEVDTVKIEFKDKTGKTTFQITSQGTLIIGGSKE
jgi:hypothetical protein